MGALNICAEIRNTVYNEKTVEDRKYIIKCIVEIIADIEKNIEGGL